MVVHLGPSKLDLPLCPAPGQRNTRIECSFSRWRSELRIQFDSHRTDIDNQIGKPVDRGNNRELLQKVLLIGILELNS